MYHVTSEEELCDCSVDVFLSLDHRIHRVIGLLWSIRIVELELITSIWPEITHPTIAAFPILVSEDIVTPGVGGIPETLLATHTLRNGRIMGVRK